MTKRCFLAIAILIVLGCTTVPNVTRTHRPEALVLAEPKDWTTKSMGLVNNGAAIPAGRYSYRWEDKYAWYYERESGPIVTRRPGRQDYREPGAIGLLKTKDRMQLYQYQTKQQVLRGGAGELVVLMLPKRGDRIVNFEDGIPEEIKRRFTEEGTVPVSSK